MAKSRQIKTPSNSGANPPFNDIDCFLEDNEVHWQFGIPTKGNANGSMSSSRWDEGMGHQTIGNTRDGH